MRCCFSPTCLATLNATATYACNSVNIACDECGILCDNKELRFLNFARESAFVQRLERLGIDEADAVAHLCYMDLSNPNTSCVEYKCKQTMCGNIQGIPDVCMLIVFDNNTIFVPIECKCRATLRGRRVQLTSTTLINNIREKSNRLCQQPSFVVLLLNRESYNRIITREKEFIRNNIYVFPCVEHARR
jgi:hypothetical protein